MRPPTIDRKSLPLIIAALVLLGISFAWRKKEEKALFARLKSISYFQDLTTNHNLRKKLKAAKKEIAKLKLALSAYKSLQAENDRLRKMLKLKKHNFWRLQVASVISRSPSSWRSLVFLDKGREDGIKEGDIVLDSQANLLGRILKAEARRSQALLVYDPDFKIKVSLDKVFALAKGSLWRGMNIKYVPYDVEVKRGDEVFYLLPENEKWRIKVGRVSFVYKDANSLTQEIFVEPYATAQAKEVFVLKKRK